MSDVRIQFKYTLHHAEMAHYLRVPTQSRVMAQPFSEQQPFKHDFGKTTLHRYFSTTKPKGNLRAGWKKVGHRNSCMDNGHTQDHPPSKQKGEGDLSKGNMWGCREGSHGTSPSIRATSLSAQQRCTAQGDTDYLASCLTSTEALSMKLLQVVSVFSYLCPSLAPRTSAVCVYVIILFSPFSCSLSLSCSSSYPLPFSFAPYPPTCHLRDITSSVKGFHINTFFCVTPTSLCNRRMDDP